ncbi:hypothetical protein BAUCODRAFT_370343 [Baudoinia panamericana UAMH 10762]|uniref:Uncharacterized protein n=1 Tax=Baudoinia panamericana (strain UAMH 10762) TaxID=717646 RepID=M2MTK1_BAUPA|nr:uncharacterized protein BAUCODRAFT_370343 [Baudoinia panamericana UAMH 10762]EMD00237.1 hypothetical protein BAUCODRAFT_370343 [Baudoinia panamericana UAMH 10762]
MMASMPSRECSVPSVLAVIALDTEFVYLREALGRNGTSPTVSNDYGGSVRSQQGLIYNRRNAGRVAALGGAPPLTNRYRTGVMPLVAPKTETDEACSPARSWISRTARSADLRGRLSSTSSLCGSLQVTGGRK